MPRRSSHQLPRRSLRLRNRSRLEPRVSTEIKSNDVDGVGSDRRVVVEGEGEVEFGSDGSDDVGDVGEGFGDGGEAERRRREGEGRSALSEGGDRLAKEWKGGKKT